MHVLLFAFFTSRLLSVSQYHTDCHGSSAANNKTYDLKLRFSVIKYAEEMTFLCRPREWEIGEKNKTELQHLSEEDCKRARLGASQELKTNMREWVISKRACHERVFRKMIRVLEKEMYTTVSDSRDDEFSTSAGWLNHFRCRNNFTCRRQLLPTRMPENSPRSGEVCDIFIPDFWEEGFQHLSQIAACSQINARLLFGILWCSLWCERHYCDRGENIL